MISSDHYGILEGMAMSVSNGERNAEKLKARFKARGQDVPQGFQRYAQERFTCSLRFFEASNSIVMTGGCMYHWCPVISDMERPTSDIDLHTYGRFAPPFQS